MKSALLKRDAAVASPAEPRVAGLLVAAGELLTLKLPFEKSTLKSEDPQAFALDLARNARAGVEARGRRRRHVLAVRNQKPAGRICRAPHLRRDRRRREPDHQE